MKKLITLISTSFLIFNLAPAIKTVEINTKVNSTNLKMENNPLAPKAINTNIKLTGIFVQRVTKDGILYAGTATGLYRSTDGINFMKINNVEHTIQDIFINDNTGVIWVVTYDVMSSFGSELYRSKNGIDFNKSTNLFGDKFITSVAEFDGKVYVGVNDGLYASTNGTNFDKINGIPSAAQLLVAKALNTSNKTLYVVDTTMGLYAEVFKGKFSRLFGIPDITALGTDNETGTIYLAFNKTFNTIYNYAIKKLAEIPERIDSILVVNNTIYLGTEESGALYKSTNGTTFNKILDTNRSDIRGLTVDNKGVIFLGDYQNGLVALNLPYKLVNLHGADFDSNTNSFVFSNQKVIDLNPEFLDAAMLDGVSIPITSQGINLTKKQQKLVLILKNQYRNYADLFGGTKGNQVINYQLTVN